MANITFKGSPVHTIGSLPRVGEKAPNFTLVNRDLSESTLNEYPNKKKILNIVPSLDTGVCALSAKTFYEKLKSRDDVILINISNDLPFAQGRFCKSEDINTITLSGFRSSFADDYGVKIIDGPLAGLCSRAVILLDEQNKIIYTEQVPEIGKEPDYNKLLQNI